MQAVRLLFTTKMLNEIPQKLEVKYRKSWKQNTAKVCNEMPQMFATATEYLLFFTPHTQPIISMITGILKQKLPRT